MSRGPVASHGASTVVPATTAAANAKQKVLSAAQTGLQKIFFTSSDLKDPERLYQVISKLRDFLVQALQPLRSCPIVTGNLITGQQFVPNTPVYVKHGLGRPWVGYVCTNQSPNGWAGAVVGYPTGLTSSMVIPLINAYSGSYDFWIF